MLWARERFKQGYSQQSGVPAAVDQGTWDGCHEIASPASMFRAGQAHEHAEIVAKLRERLFWTDSEHCDPNKELERLIADIETGEL
jgi:hypothetical protein